MDSSKSQRHTDTEAEEEEEEDLKRSSDESHRPHITQFGELEFKADDEEEKDNTYLRDRRDQVFIAHQMENGTDHNTCEKICGDKRLLEKASYERSSCREHHHKTDLHKNGIRQSVTSFK